MGFRKYEISLYSGIYMYEGVRHLQESGHMCWAYCACHRGIWMSRNDDRTVLENVRWSERYPLTCLRLYACIAKVEHVGENILDCCHNSVPFLWPSGASKTRPPFRTTHFNR